MLIERSRVLQRALLFIYVLIVAMSLGIAAQCILLFDVVPHIDFVLSSGAGAHYLVNRCAKIVFNILILAIFCSFAWSTARRHTVFSRTQSMKMGAIGLLLSVDFIMTSIAPKYTPPAGMFFKLEPSVPVIDYRLLSFAIMFFALAAVFEYGRLLQEDSDDIL